MKYTYVKNQWETFKISDGHLSYFTTDKFVPTQKKELSKIDLMRFVDAIERALWNTEEQCKENTMGVSQLLKALGDETSIVYIAPKTDTQEELDGLFAAYVD